MSKYKDRAMALRNDPLVHYNCAQAVVMPFAGEAGVPEERLCALSANFGSGMRIGSVCGAITGGLMVLGLFGLTDPKLINSYYKTLRERHSGCVDCTDLLRMNAETGTSRRVHCDGMIYECIDLVEKYLKEAGAIV